MCGDPRILHRVLVSESQCLLAMLRQLPGSSSYLFSREDRSRQRDRIIHALQAVQECADERKGIQRQDDRVVVIRPFLDIVVSSRTSGEITVEALRAVQRMIKSGFFSLRDNNALMALNLLAEALPKCRFEATDAAGDEAVFDELLKAILTCIKGDLGLYLSDLLVWELFQTCIRIHRQMRPPVHSKLLSHVAEEALEEFVRFVFSSLRNSNTKKTLTSESEELHPSNLELMEEAFGAPCIVKIFASFALMVKQADILHKNEGNSDISWDVFKHPKGSQETAHSRMDSLSSSFRGELSDSGLLTLKLILVSIEEAGPEFATLPALITLVKDDVCVLLLKCARTVKPKVLGLVLRIFYNLLWMIRDQMKMQIEVFINSVYLRLAVSGPGPKLGDFSKASTRLNFRQQNAGKNPSAMAEQESGLSRQSFRIYDEVSDECAMVLLDGLVVLAQLPWFAREMYVNYDCDVKCTNIFQNIVRVLCHYAFPLNGYVTGKHEIAIHALRCLLKNINHAAEIPFSLEEGFAQTMRSEKIRKEVLAECIEEFNAKPKRGIRLLFEKKFISSLADSDAIASILRTTAGFSKTRIGEYLGEDDAVCLSVCKSFIASFDFKNRTIDDAFRMCVESFRLPKETQQIDRILQVFASHFYDQNSSMFASADAVYMLIFSILMLHTVSHSDKVKDRDKMSLQDWLRNNRDINDGYSLPREYLVNLYSSITKNEFQVSETGMGGVIHQTLWVDLLSRPWGRDYVCYGAEDLDADIFEEIWNPAMAALLVVYNTAEKEFALDSATEAFLSISSLAARHSRSDVLDELIFCLFQLTGFSSDLSSETSAILEFGRDEKRRNSAILLFKIVREYSNELRASWMSIFSLLFSFLRLNCLPSDSYVLDDFLDGTQYPVRQLSFNVKKAEPVQSISSLFSAVSALFMPTLQVDENKDMPEEEISTARQKCLDCVQKANPLWIFANQKSLSYEAFQSMIRFLLASLSYHHRSQRSRLNSTSEQPNVHSFAGETLRHVEVNYDDDDDYSIRSEDSSSNTTKVPRFFLGGEIYSKQSVYYLQILSDSLINNCERVTLDLLTEALTLSISLLRELTSYSPDMQRNDLNFSFNVDFVLEAVVVTFWKLVDAFIKLSRARQVIIERLIDFFSLNLIAGRPPRLGLQVLSGGYYFLKTNYDLIFSTENVRLVNSFFELILQSMSYPIFSAISLKILVFLFEEKSVSLLSPGIIDSATKSIIEFVMSNEQSASKNFQVAISWNEILLSQLPVIESEIADSDSSLWKGVLKSSFSPLHTFSVCSHSVVREAALENLLRILSSNVAANLSNLSLKFLFSELLDITENLSQTSLPADDFLHSRLLCIKLLSKSFLLYLDRLICIESEFHQLWISILNSLNSLSKLSHSHRSILAECVVESVKNMILVMDSLEIFSKSNHSYALGEELFELTWAVLDPVFPQLKAEIFPEPSSPQSVEKISVALNQ